MIGAAICFITFYAAAVALIGWGLYTVATWLGAPALVAFVPVVLVCGYLVWLLVALVTEDGWDDG